MLSRPVQREAIVHDGLEPVDSKFYPSIGTMSYTEKFMFSQAISMKRIADSLEKLSALGSIESIIDKIAQHPTNQYGEGFSESIQNSIARGLAGINTGELRR